MPYCAINWCKKKSQTSNCNSDGVTFHRFPRNFERKEKWIEACFRPDTWFPTKNSSMCSMHFEETCFYQHGTTRRLYETSVPTLNLPALVSNIDVKQEHVDYDDDNKPRPIRILKSVKRLQRIRVKPMSKQAVKATVTLKSGLQPIAPKISSAVLDSLQQIGPGTFVPIDFKPLLKRSIAPNLKIPTLVSTIQPLQQTNMKAIANKGIVTTLNTSKTIISADNNKIIEVYVQGPSPKILQNQEEIDNSPKNDENPTENAIPAVYKVRVLKNKVEQLKYALKRKNKHVKCLQDQVRTLKLKVVNLKKIVESLVKVKDQ